MLQEEGLKKLCGNSYPSSTSFLTFEKVVRKPFTVITVVLFKHRAQRSSLLLQLFTFPFRLVPGSTFIASRFLMINLSTDWLNTLWCEFLID